ncbi:dienelactone hydrolase family protein [Bradyrhizobium sp. RD5-C2]|uniref:dienelactone hydrolase family protein n=1 Tax=Bradyrhizobium sp. RD5-C2 TaxID=244562 RepID=UPI001CC606A9|nr:dienelactone hydrolase family protein [Bradyrhizobium sp. RD5-C2]GIQ78268.1 dienelactone hydrolase [Bradyrhizobium sp. RD5-C2]
MSNLNQAISGSDKSFSGYLTGVEAELRPGIVLLHEIFGVNNAMRMAADQFAGDGFVVLVPDLFHQIRPGIELGYSEDDRATAIGYWQVLVDEQVRRDVAAAVATLRKHPACNGQVAIVGFCLGGKYALLAAHLGIADATVSFYPVQAPSYEAELRDLRCPVQVHVGDDDAHVSLEAHGILENATGKPPHEYKLHPGAGHGFFNKVRSFGFHPKAAALAYTQSVEFIKTAFKNVNKREAQP